MNLRIVLLIITSIFLTISAYSQDCFPSKSEKFTRIKNSTLLIIISKDEDQNYVEALKRAFSSEWKYSKYKFIAESEVPNYYRKEGYVFHARIRYSVNNGVLGFNQFGIWGNYFKKTISDLNDLSPLAYMNVGNIFVASTYEYCLPNILKAFNDFMFYAEANKFNGGMGPLFKTLSSDITDHYNSKTKWLNTKTLYILSDQVDQAGKDFIAKGYVGKVEYVDEQKIKEAIDNGDENIAYLYIGQSSVSAFMYIYTTKGEIIFLERDVYTFSKTNPNKIILTTKNVKNFVNALTENFKK